MKFFSYLCIAAFLGVSLAGCGDDGSRITPVLNERGEVVKALELAVECPKVLASGTTGGCTTGEPVYPVFNPTRDARVRTHELEHVAGMRHTGWAVAGSAVCATVTAPGATAWRAGERICLDSRGDYYKGGA